MGVTHKSDVETPGRDHKAKRMWQPKLVLGKIPRICSQFLGFVLDRAIAGLVRQTIND